MAELFPIDVIEQALKHTPVACAYCVTHYYGDDAPQMTCVHIVEALAGVRRQIFAPFGDNHHNAVVCPYCSPPDAAEVASAGGDRAVEILVASIQLHDSIFYGSASEILALPDRVQRAYGRLQNILRSRSG